jgi:DNA-directed RNA polymerase specialized sigma subunit
MKIEQLLKESLGAEKEAWAIVEASEMLTERAGREQCDITQLLLSEYFLNLELIQKKYYKVAKIISVLPFGDMKNIFNCRYRHKMTWEEIGEITNYSISQVHRIHKDGVKWLEQYWTL